MPVELRVPQSGESITEVQIGEWLKSEGDVVQRDEILVELETDKASLELPAPVSGRIAKILKRNGEIAAVGDVIAIIEPAAEPSVERAAVGTEPTATGPRPQEQPPAPQAEEPPRPAPQAEKPARRPEPALPPSQTVATQVRDRARAGGKAEPAPREPAPRPQEQPPSTTQEPAEQAASIEVRPRIMPAARRALAEHGLTPEEIRGTGPGGRILKEDVERHVEELRTRRRPPQPPPAAQPPAPPTGEREDELVPMSMLRRRVAQRLVEAQQNAALLTTFNEIDMSGVLNLRQQHQASFQQRYGVKLGIMSFFVRASVDALKRFPQLNAEVREQSILYHKYYDIGVAVSTEKGLVVPVLRDADKMSFAEIERNIEDLARRARDNKLKLEELEGGTFTITNGGIFGSLLSTPIVNPPQSGILGLHAIQERPVALGGNVVIRPTMYVALTYDHRIVDGREAVTFLRHISEVIKDPARLLIEA